MKLNVTIARCGDKNYVALGSPTLADRLLPDLPYEADETVRGEINVPIEISELIFRETAFVLVHESSDGVVSSAGCLQTRSAAYFRMNQLTDEIESGLAKLKKKYKEVRYLDTTTITTADAVERIHIAELRFEHLDKAA